MSQGQGISAGKGISDDEGGAVGSRRVLLLLVLALAPFVVFVNVTGITAIEELIGKGLNVTGSSLTTFVNVTSIATAPLILFSGHLADRFRRKPIYLWGALLFALGSLGTAVAQNVGEAIVARAIQGLGAGAVTALSLGLIAHRLGESRRGLAIGVWGSGVGLGLALGPIVGAGIAGSTSLSWRYFFGLLVVITLLIMLFTYLGVPDDETVGGSGTRLDGFGSLLAGLGIVGIVLGVTYGGSWGWTNAKILLALVGGVVVLLLFGIYEFRRPGGVIRVSAFAVPSYSLAGFVTIVNLIVVIAVFVYVGLQLQVNLHVTSLREGVYYLPFSALVLVLSPIFGRVVDRFGPRPVLICVELAATVGLLYLALVVPQSNGSYGLLVPGLVLLGLAAAGGAPATSTTLVATRPRSEVGEASAVNGTLVQIGSAIGAGVAVAIFSSHFPGALVAAVVGLHLGSATHSTLSAVASGQLSHLPIPILLRVVSALHSAFSAALKPLLITLAVLSFLAGIASLRISRNELGVDE